MAKKTIVRFPDGRRFEVTQIPDGRWKVQNLADKRGWSLYETRRDAIEHAEDMGGRVE